MYKHLQSLLLLHLALLTASPSLLAQSTVAGLVRDARSKEPVAGAFVLGLSGLQQKAYAYADREGCFVLKVPDSVIIDQLRVSMMGYESVAMPLTSGKWDGVVLELKEKRTELRAAQVSATIVEERGDTLTYTVGAFRDGTERSMGDLLEKIPGLTVTTSGGIQHNGRYIGKLYVEGLDLMGAQYGTVTRNLSADAIARVEIYQDHQPVRALEDLSKSDRSAINIVLKEGLRSTWMFSCDAAIGLPPFPLFEARAMLSNFGKQRQSLFLIKGNNDGGDILQELQRQSILGRGPGAYLITPGEVDDDLRSRLNPGRSYLPLPKEYWYDNLSGLGSFHHLVKLGETRQFRFVTQAAGERYSEASDSMDEIHFADGSSLAVREVRQMDDRRGYFSGSFAYEDNAPQHYVSDELTVAGQLRANSTYLLGNSHPYTEHYDLPTIKLANHLKVVHRLAERRALEISSDSRYRRGRHEAVYATGGQEYGQLLFFHDFSADIRSSQNWSRGLHRISLAEAVALSYVGREAQASNLPLPEAFAGVKTEGALSALALRPSVRLSDRLSFGKTELTLALPATLHYLILKGIDNMLYPTMNPSVAFRWKPSQRIELSASTSYALTRSDVESLLDAAVMQSWRTLAEADSLRRSGRWNTQATLRWCDIPTMIFASLSGSFSMGRSDRATASVWTDAFSFQYYLPLATATSGWSVSGSLKKYFGLKAFVVELQGGWMSNRMQEYLQGVPLDYRSSQIHTKLNFTSNPVWWFSTDVSGSYDVNYVDGDSRRRTRVARVEGSLRLKPVKALSLDATTHWLWYEIPGETVFNKPLIKISASWALENATLFVECRNLLNASEYRRESISTYHATTTVTALRGRLFLVGIRMAR